MYLEIINEGVKIRKIRMSLNTIHCSQMLIILNKIQKR